MTSISTLFYKRKNSLSPIGFILIIIPKIIIQCFIQEIFLSHNKINKGVQTMFNAWCSLCAARERYSEKIFSDPDRA